MENPWDQLPKEPPFLLPSDREPILAFNDKVRPEYQIRPELLPEPSIGRPEAEIVLLNLNPGFSNEDLSFQAQTAFRKLYWQNLFHEPSTYPFYLIEPGP